MLPVNIPPRVRFVLYILGALAGPLISYAFAVSWVGKPEVALGASLVSLLQLLAAAKTDLSSGGPNADYQGRHEVDPAASFPGPHAGCRTDHPHTHPVSQPGPTPDDPQPNLPDPGRGKEI